ncbi:DUF3014 domain-containing protein [Motiliproteus sediminis]|uniref:DUF3014 domain-containing protein n=1 Tax=Motiliproteus sediminis TaxID=1468178 RepID=UPI001AEFD022|nr:DUF3014 domain-containing protein [Motiliproteus sediminis]
MNGWPQRSIDRTSSCQVQHGAGLLRGLVALAAVGMVAAVGYLLLQPGALPSGLTLSPTPVNSDPLPADSPPAADPVLTQERLQLVAPPEQVESPPDALDSPPLADERATEAAVVAPKPSLPTLDDSDALFRDGLLGLDPSNALADLLIDAELIRKFVVVVDNMAEGRIPRKHSLLRGPKEGFKASETASGLWLDGYNFGRYSLYVGLVEGLPTDAAVGLYQRYYPLMQQAYAELGYPRRSFHQRLLQALDHLLDSPLKSRALALEQPSVMYKFADPELERLSAVHKQMLRLGPANAELVLARVTLLRTALGRLDL